MFNIHRVPTSQCNHVTQVCLDSTEAAVWRHLMQLNENTEAGVGEARLEHVICAIIFIVHLQIIK